MSEFDEEDLRRLTQLLERFTGSQGIHVSAATSAGDLGAQGAHFKRFIAQINQGFMGQIHFNQDFMIGGHDIADFLQIIIFQSRLHRL